MRPNVEQQKSNADQHKAISRIGRSRPAQQFIAQQIARLDTKPPLVSVPTPFRRPVQSDHYKQQPIRTTLAAFSAPRRGEDMADGQLRRELILLAFIEGVAGAITRSPSAQSPGPTFFAADRTGDQRRLLASAQVFERRDAGKTFIEIEDSDPQPSQQQHLSHLPDHFYGLIPRQNGPNRQSHSLRV